MIVDIAHFLLIFYLGIFTFAMTFRVVDIEIVKPSDQVTGSSVWLTIYYTYLTALGNFAWGGMSQTHYSKNSNELYMIILFFLTTFFIQLIMFNVIIAIMGDTYDRVVEVSEEAYYRELCLFVVEYYYLFPEYKFT
jgi:hypothetical protein